MATDHEILSLYKKKTTQNAAMQMLMSTYQERLYWHIRRMVINHNDTDDVLQNTFIKAWKGLANFKGDAKLYTWLYRIATNESLTFIDKKKKKYATALQDVEHELSNTLKSEDYFDGNAIQLKLQQALLTLPEKQRLVFNMRYFEEMKYQEMSEVLSTSVGALKASYHHAVKKIEEFIKKD